VLNFFFIWHYMADFTQRRRWFRSNGHFRVSPTFSIFSDYFPASSGKFGHRFLENSYFVGQYHSVIAFAFGWGTSLVKVQAVSRLDFNFDLRAGSNSVGLNDNIDIFQMDEKFFPAGFSQFVTNSSNLSLSIKYLLHCQRTFIIHFAATADTMLYCIVRIN